MRSRRRTVHVVCLDCGCEGWSLSETMAAEFEQAHQAHGHAVTRKATRPSEDTMSEDKWATPQAYVDHLVDDLGADPVDAALLTEYLEWETERQIERGRKGMISVSPERFKAWLEGDR